MPIYTIADAAASTGLPLGTIYDRVKKLALGKPTAGGTVILSDADLKKLVKYKGKRGRRWPEKESK